MTPVRSRIYWADLGHGEKPWVCVSNNIRNQHLGSFLAVRVTTSSKPMLDSIVPLTAQDPLVGSVLCDDIVEIFREEVVRETGAVSLGTMMAVGAGLRSALALL